MGAVDPRGLVLEHQSSATRAAERDALTKGVTWNPHERALVAVFAPISPRY